MYVVLSILFYVTIYLHTSPVLKSSKLEFDKYQNIFVRHFAPQSIVSFRQRSLFPLELDIYTKDLQRAKLRKSITGHNFWRECPSDLRSTSLSCIFNALFRDTSFAHFLSRRVCHVCHVTCVTSVTTNCTASASLQTNFLTCFYKRASLNNISKIILWSRLHFVCLSSLPYSPWI